MWIWCVNVKTKLAWHWNLAEFEEQGNALLHESWWDSAELPSCDQKLEWDFECGNVEATEGGEQTSWGGRCKPPAGYGAEPRSKKIVSKMKKKYYLKLKDVFQITYNVCFNIIFKFAIKSWTNGSRIAQSKFTMQTAVGSAKFRCSVPVDHQVSRPANVFRYTYKLLTGDFPIVQTYWSNILIVSRSRLCYNICWIV